MSNAPDSRPDIRPESPDTTGDPLPTSPDDSQAAALEPDIRQVDAPQEPAPDALAEHPASAQTTRELGSASVAGELEIAPIGTTARHGGKRNGKDGGTASDDGNADEGNQERAPDHRGDGEPPEHGDTRGELGDDDDPETIRRELEMRAVQESSRIIQALPIDVEHATTIANGQADIAIAVGIRRDSETGNNVYDSELLAHTRTTLTGLAARMGAEQQAIRQQIAPLQEGPEENRDTDQIDDLRIEASHYGMARSDIETGALTRIMTAETLAGSEVAERLLAERVMEDRDHVAAYRGIVPDTIVRPKGEGPAYEQSVDYANTFCITKAAEQLGEPIPSQVLEPEEPGDAPEYEVRLLLLEHDYRLGQSVPGATDGDPQAEWRAAAGVQAILNSLEADSSEQPDASQLIGTFPRLLTMAGPGDAKQRITTQYLDKVEAHIAGRTLDAQAYADIVKAGCDVYDDPSIFNDPRVSGQVVARFNGIISNLDSKFRLEAEEHGVDPLMRSALIDQTIHIGAEWHARMSTLRVSDEDSPQTVTRISEEITPANLSPRTMDAINLIYARELTKTGETPTARVLIEMFTRDETMIADSLAECLQVAVKPDPIFGEYHPELVEAFEPHPSMVRDLPDVGLVYNAALAITRQSVAHIGQAAREIVGSLDAPASSAENTQMKLQWINALLTRADELDPARGMVLRRAVLPDIQATAAANLNPHAVHRIYQTLARSGQAEDWRAMRNAVNRIDPHEGETNDLGLNTWGPLARLFARPPVR